MTINLPLFSQRDDRWKAKKLGNSLLTLGTAGCLVSCLAMEAKYYNKDTDPARMDDDLIRVNGFADTNLYIWGSINKIYPDISEPKRVQTPNPVTSAQFATIEAELSAGRPVLAEVDFVPATASVDMHFVVIIGKEGDQWIVADPWWGDTASLTRYGDPAKTIQQFIFTFGPTPAQPVTNPSTDQANALAVIKEAYDGLPTDDLYKPGNLEGFTRGIVEEHKHFKEYEMGFKQFNALIEKWFMEWHLSEDPNKSHQVLVEEEAGKLLQFEDTVIQFRDAIEKVTGHFDTDDALLKALGAVNDDREQLRKDLAKCKNASVWKVFTFGPYLIKVYKEEVKK